MAIDVCPLPVTVFPFTLYDPVPKGTAERLPEPGDREKSDSTKVPEAASKVSDKNQYMYARHSLATCTRGARSAGKLGST